MKSFLECRDRWGNGYSLWLLVGMVFLIPLTLWSLRGIRMKNDVAGWLPQNDPQSRILNWYQDLFSADDRVLVSWDDCSLTDPRLQELSFRLRGLEKNGVREGGSPYVRDVKLPHDLLRRMIAEGVPLETALERTTGLLIGRGPLCLTLSDEGRSHVQSVSQAIISLAADRFDLSVQVVERTLSVPSDKHLTLDDEKSWKLHDQLTAWVQSRPRADLQICWPGMHIDSGTTDEFRKALSELTIASLNDARCTENSFFMTGAMAALSVTFSEAGEADHTEALAAIQTAAERAGIPKDTLHIGGRAVASTALNHAVKHTGWNSEAPFWNRSPLLLSVLVSVGLSYLMLKDLRLCVLVQGVSVLCAAGTVALIPLTGGSMNMVLIVMPTLLMVISVSGAIHICNYWKNSGIDHPGESVVKAVSVAWLPCFLASATTAIGLASLVVSSLRPVRDFGIYSSVGCLFSFVCVLYVLPSLMSLWPARPPHPEHLHNDFWKWLGGRLTRHRTLTLAGNTVLVFACMWGLWWFRTETKVIRYFPDEAKVVRDYNFLEQNLSGIVSVDTIIRFDVRQQEEVAFPDRARKVLEVQEALQQHTEVSGALSLASFMNLERPDFRSMSGMERRNARMRENLIGARIHEKIRKGGADAAGLAAMLALPETAGDWKKPGDELLNKPGDEIWRITCQSSIMSKYDLGLLTRELASIAETHLADFPTGKPEHLVTGLVPIFLRTQQALLESLIESFGMALVVIWLVMVCLFRNPWAALFSMLPNIFPIAVMFGLLGWWNIHVDIGSMITASVALGIAVDGTLHLMTWFQQLIRAGVPRQEAAARAIEHCGPALWQTSAAIGFGMLTLYPVELLLISRFGWIMCALIFLALWGDVVLLPALLAGTLGSILESMESRRQSRQAQDLPAAALESPAQMAHVLPIGTTDSDVTPCVPCTPNRAQAIRRDAACAHRIKDL